MRNNRIHLALAAIAMLAAGSAVAQSYPNRPVRVVIPQAAGGAVDVAWRPIAQKLGENAISGIPWRSSGLNGLNGMARESLSATAAIAPPS